MRAISAFIVVVLYVQRLNAAFDEKDYEMMDTEGKGTGVYTLMHWNMTRCTPQDHRVCFGDHPALVVFDADDAKGWPVYRVYTNDTTTALFVWSASQVGDNYNLEVQIADTDSDSVPVFRADHVRKMTLTMVHYDHRQDFHKEYFASGSIEKTSLYIKMATVYAEINKSKGTRNSELDQLLNKQDSMGNTRL